MLCGEHPEPVSNGFEIGSLNSDKACSEVPKRYNGLWAQIQCELEYQAGRL